MEKCRICNQLFNSVLGLTTHLSLIHKFTFKKYIQQYFDIPICPYCNIKTLKIPNRPFVQKKRSGDFWLKTCGDKQCIHKFNIISKREYQKTEQAKIKNEKIRKARFKYLKKKTNKTAWQRKANGQLSCLEQWFLTDVIERYNLNQKYDIINELPIYPYFIDFAFCNIKLAVQLDGKQHFYTQRRINKDIKKDRFLMDNGWKVFRIKYNETNQQIIKQFLSYLENIFIEDKKLQNRIYKYRQVKEKYYQNITKTKLCPNCNKKISFYSKQCKTCYDKNRRKVQRPTKQILQEQIKHHSMLSLGRKYGVSDNAIRKWCKQYGIDYHYKKSVIINNCLYCGKEVKNMKYCNRQCYKKWINCNSITLQYNGEIHTISQWAKTLGLTYFVILNKYKRGLTPQQIFKK